MAAASRALIHAAAAEYGKAGKRGQAQRSGIYRPARRILNIANSAAAYSDFGKQFAGLL